MGKIDIVLISWMRPEITELAIRTIRRNTKPETHRLIVMDNGSPKEQKKMLEYLQDNGYIDELFLYQFNVGLETARQDSLQLIDSEWFVCADNDCLPQPIEDSPCVECRKDWLEKLVDLQTLNPDYKSIACRTQVMIGTGNIFEGHENEGLVEFPHPGGSFRLMNTEIVKNLGGWEGKPGRGAEERWIGAKLASKGHKSAFATNVKCLHLFGKKDTDRWGYDKDWQPEVTGHSDIWHPVLERGDDYEEVKEYTGEENAKSYFADMQ